MHRIVCPIFCLSFLFASACGDDDASTDGDAALDGSAEGGSAEGGMLDSSTTADGSMDAGEDAQPTADGGALCAFNRECPDSQRCECTEEDGCFCAPGARGTGELGESCEDGNDCVSSVCLEGPDDALLCSIECENEEQCGGALPRCTEVVLVGKICTREPPQ